jgi:hypothetical protein
MGPVSFSALSAAAESAKKSRKFILRTAVRWRPFILRIANIPEADMKKAILSLAVLLLFLVPAQASAQPVTTDAADIAVECCRTPRGPIDES